jgi:hypothetical protein
MVNFFCEQLEAYGVRGIPLFISHLSNCFQDVAIIGIVLRYVTQGRILLPISSSLGFLFIILSEFFADVTRGYYMIEYHDPL